LADVDVRGYTDTQAVTRHALYAAIALCLLVPAVLGAGLPERVLRTRPLLALGRISYGIYLYHLTVLGLAGKWHLANLEDDVHPYLLWSVVAIGGSVLAAAVSWKLVEEPLLALKKRGGPRLRPSHGGSAPAD
jgi:peptidoglycan/LPS O-acetylase OafA/YrhL